MGKLLTTIHSLLDYLFGSGTPASFTLKLTTTVPTESTVGTSPVSLWTNYLDKTITNNATNFPAASGGSKTYSGATVDFGAATVPGTQPTIVGWELYNGATRIYCGVIGSTGRKPFTATTTDVFTCPGHGLADGKVVVLEAMWSESLPTGVSAGTLYYVRDVSGDTFKLAATSGGTAIDLTAAGVGTFQVCNPQTIANGSPVTMAASAFVITEG